MYELNGYGFSSHGYFMESMARSPRIRESEKKFSTLETRWPPFVASAPQIPTIFVCSGRQLFMFSSTTRYDRSLGANLQCQNNVADLAIDRIRSRTLLRRNLRR